MSLSQLFRKDKDGKPVGIESTLEMLVTLAVVDGATSLKETEIDTISHEELEELKDASSEGHTQEVISELVAVFSGKKGYLDNAVLPRSFFNRK
jgi:hypothetical protein